MLFPGIKKLGKELNLKRTDSEVVGLIKNCFVKMYDGRNMKILELYVPEMDDDDKNNIIKKLEARKIKKYEWVSSGVKIIFIETVVPYSIKKIKELLDELVNYFNNKYPAQKPKCQHCGQQNETDIYCINDASLLICNDCYNKAERAAQNENMEQNNIKGNYLFGFIGALLFAVPGILLTVLFLVYLNRLAAVSAVAYISLGIIGYVKFKGKKSPAGAVIVIIAALLMVGVGVIAAYAVLIFKELKEINFDSLIFLFKVPEIQKELVTNLILSYIVSSMFIFFKFYQIFKEWKNKKSIQKPREIL